ncbi:hypothetical protein P5G51_001870 [Virgibacillus sp. 179-BFC.A HS]|uniref:Uncharacterized protein n=1 Tax=Tigheibacillus jepli TaxID=3035914 RepID=A0ABU5CDH3_9BACI|nr:hypothetical protein [Virgibacillus sp. 179-BFC.A HS]MDY0404326.1 hypothetical protein [Virgibacillus sp. 179-BFC.A HS]
MNEKNVLDIEGLNAKLQEWCGNEITVEKDELRDKDRIHMHLASISYDKNTRKIDDYQATYTLRLHGEGNVQTDKKEQTLPQDVYEIPLEDTATVQMQDQAIILETDRGHYRLTR